MDISERGETVLAELKLLVALSTEQARLQPESFRIQSLPNSSSHDLIPDTVSRNRSGSNSMSIRFPTTRSRTSSTVKGRRPGALEAMDENLFQQTPRNSLGLARTVRRTLSGGLSNILRPFQPQQPPIMKQNCHDNCKADSHPPPSGFHKIKRKVSSNFSRGVIPEDSKVRAPVKEQRSQKRRATITGSKTVSTRNRKARESVCSRNSTISVLEYLAARRHEDEPEQENLVPLSEYGRNCHLYGCDSPHIWNPDKNSSCPIIHCECDNDDRSKAHVHIDETHSLFYKPGGSTSTVTQSVAQCASSVLANMSNESIRSRQRPSNPILDARYSSSVASHS